MAKRTPQRPAIAKRARTAQSKRALSPDASNSPYVHAYDAATQLDAVERQLVTSAAVAEMLSVLTYTGTARDRTESNTPAASPTFILGPSMATMAVPLLASNLETLLRAVREVRSTVKSVLDAMDAEASARLDSNGRRAA